MPSTEVGRGVGPNIQGGQTMTGEFSTVRPSRILANTGRNGPRQSPRSGHRQKEDSGDRLKSGQRTQSLSC